MDKVVRRILLVEDNAINQKVTCAMLSNLDCEVDIAQSGLEALELCKNDYHLIFMDIGLPDIDGIEVTKKIRKQDPSSPPIIAMTAYSLDVDKESCLNAGMNAMLIKPVSFKTLQTTLEQWAPITIN